MQHVPHTKISLHASPDLTEKWVQAILVDETSLLGLGDLDVKEVERRQPHAGRLDLLLSDAETGTRYEVELQLGATDESHIIRTIEYWDSERRRYPQYDHVAVIIAEEITARFFNVISLFNGFIPIIAIQMAAISVGSDALTLVFTKVLDRTILGTDEEDEGAPTDRKYWDGRATPATVSLADQILELARLHDPAVDLKYNKFYIGLARSGVAANYVTMRPRKKKLNLSLRIPRSDEITARIEDAGIDTLSYDARWSDYRLSLTKDDVEDQADLLSELILLAKRGFDS